MINQALANNMLKNIADPKLRETYGNILSGKYAYKVLCMNPGINPDTKKQFHKKGMPIGFITKKGNVIDAQAQDPKTKQPIAGIETSRDRLDGRKGFRCYCGNWSIQCEEEYGKLDSSPIPFAAAPPTKEQMMEIFEKVQKSGKGPLQFIKGRAEYDGFALEEITE